jgi:deoxyribose-phosphate aldolase
VAENPDFEALVTEIASRVSLRLNAARVGAEEPCTPSKPEHRTSCGPTCGDCPGAAKSGCGTFALLSLGGNRVSPDHGSNTSADIAQYIDHTLLKPEATRDDVVKLCEEARQYGFATVCVNSANVALAARTLKGSSTVPIAVVGFPLGAALSSAKAFEAREAVRSGAREIDMVLNIGALKSRDYRTVGDDIRAVVEACRPVPVKVILETSQLDTEQKIIACALAKAGGAAFVKTSTGFGGGGATAEDVALMRRIVGEDMGVKASGGVRSTEDAKRFLAAGANRLGASASVAIVTGQKSKAAY